MCKIDERYYNGFEGEPELVFTLLKKNGEKNAFGIWDGYFDSIIKKVEPQKEGWTGLAYYYHLDIGWFEESPWLVENMLESFEQLNEIDVNSLEMNEDKKILSIIKALFQEAIDNDGKIFISYE